jgi:hypothetical protein
MFLPVQVGALAASLKRKVSYKCCQSEALSIKTKKMFSGCQRIQTGHSLVAGKNACRYAALKAGVLRKRKTASLIENWRFDLK